MKLKKLRCLSLMTGLMVPLLVCANPATDMAQRHEAAMVEYEACHWTVAYQAFKSLADAGHQPSARVALMMAARGPALYGQAFEASAPQRQRWSTLQMRPAEIDRFVAPERLASR